MLELKVTKMSIMALTDFKGYKLVSPTTNGQHNSSNLLGQDGGENEASRNGQNYYGNVEPFSIQRDHIYCLIPANCNKTEVDC